MIVSAQEVLDFWFDPATEEKWFNGGDAFDAEIRKRFYETWLAACRGELFQWRETLPGRVAEIVVLDQFSRNLNRGSGLSYSQDDMALVLSQELLGQDGFENLPDPYRRFAIMPFMHAESRVIQEISVDLFKKHSDEETVKYAVEHQRIVDQFGRFPHRNQAIGRESTAAELEFMEVHDGF